MHAVIFRILAVAALLGGLSACSSPLDEPRKQALETMARQAAAADVALTSRPDLTTVAVLDFDRQADRTQHMRRPVCDGYCLRLLYTGEATTVISGTAMVLAPAACADMLAARAANRIDPRGETAHFDWPTMEKCRNYSDFVRETVPEGAHETPDDIWPQSWQGAGRTYTVMVRAYHLESRAHCPDTKYHDSLADYGRGSAPSPADTEKAVTAAIASGRCLIETPANLNQAASIILFEDDEQNNSDPHGPLRDTRFEAVHVTVFGPGKHILYRHTRSDYSYLPVLAPAAYFDDASFFATASSEKTTLIDRLRTDVGLKLAEVKTAPIDLRAALSRAVDDPELTFISSAWTMVPDYLNDLKTRPPEKADLTLLAHLIRDGRPTVQLRDLDDLVVARPEIAAAVSGPLLDALNGFGYKVRENGVPWLTGNDEERRMIGAAGGEHDDLFNAGLERVAHIDTAFAKLPDAALSDHLPAYEKLIGEPNRLSLVPDAAVHMNLLPPALAVSRLRPLITDGSHDATHRTLRIAALRAACRMGDAARPLLPELKAVIAAAPVQDHNMHYDMADVYAADIAARALSHFEPGTPQTNTDPALCSRGV